MPDCYLHVVFFPSSYPSSWAPVKGIFYQEQAHALQNESARIGVVYPENRRLCTATPGTLLNNRWHVTIQNEEGVRLVRLHGWNLPSTRLRAWMLVHQYRHLFQTYIRRFGRPDLIHAHTALWGGYAAATVSAEIGIPFVLTAHSSGFERALYSGWELERAATAFQNTGCTIAVSRALARQIKPYVGDRNVCVIPNMVNTNRFCLPDAPRTSRPFTLLTVAKLKANKGIDILLRAFAHLYSKRSDVRLLIGGEGPELEPLRQLACELGIASNVSFLGLLSREDVRMQMQSANVYVSSSHVETFGIALIEAMATGMPVVATRSGGPQDIVTEQTGWLAEPGNVDDLARALHDTYAARDTLPKRATAIRQYAVEHFSQSMVARQIVDVYKNVIATS